MTDQIRVLIADDHTIVRSGVRLLLEAEPDITVVGEALDGVQALDLVKSLEPEVVLLDIAMPGMDGFEAARQIKSRWPNISVLFLTIHRQDEYFFQALKAGASGYVLKGADTSDLINAVRVVSRGEVFLYPAMAQRLVQDYLNRLDGDSDTGPSLSPREKEILRLIANGFSNKEIASQLVVSLSTIHTHRTNIMAKLGFNTQRELIQYARKHGLVSEI